MNEINWKPKAVKQLLKLPKGAQQTIRDEVNDKLIVFPNCSGIKKLVNHAHSYRLRAGNFRVFFDYDGDVRIISIEEVKKRDEHTY
jgi:mRNA-degrading endonuclease RelE of RelBE toxin-antitoxin system